MKLKARPAVQRESEIFYLRNDEMIPFIAMDQPAALNPTSTTSRLQMSSKTRTLTAHAHEDGCTIMLEFFSGDIEVISVDHQRARLMNGVEDSRDRRNRAFGVTLNQAGVSIGAHVGDAKDRVRRWAQAHCVNAQPVDLFDRYIERPEPEFIEGTRPWSDFTALTTFPEFDRDIRPGGRLQPGMHQDERRAV